MNKNKIMGIIIFVIVLLSISVFGLTRLVTDYLWFNALGFEQIFLITLFSKIRLFAIAAAVFFLFATINVWISSKITEKKRFPFKLKLLIITFLSIIIGMGVSSEWFKFLQFINQTSFNLVDPIFAKDVSFYIFSLPFYQFILGFLMNIIILTAILVVVDYLISFIDFKQIFTKPKIPEGLVSPPPKSFDFKMLFISLLE